MPQDRVRAPWSSASWTCFAPVEGLADAMNGSAEEDKRALPQGAADRMRARTGELFVEVQRADSKATVVCGLAGGLLAVGVAALSTVGSSAWPAKIAFALACGGLAAALVAALLALRPVLPRDRTLTGLDGPCPGKDPDAVVAALAFLDHQGQVRADAFQVARLAALAHRKFKIIKLAVDLTIITLGLAGMGLLITYVAH